MEANQFDRVARAVGQDTARRRLLAGLLGAVLAGLGLGAGAAKRHQHQARKRRHRAGQQRSQAAKSAKAPACKKGKGGNSECAQFCAVVFGADTAAAAQCTSEGTRCQGLCATCGTSTAPSALCCPRESNGLCTAYAAASCCGGTTPTCTDGTCVCQGDSCGEGQVCCGGTCQECCRSADCVGEQLGMVCENHVCRPCVDRRECDPTLRTLRICTGSSDVPAGVCADFGQCICPGTCADCTSDRACGGEGGGSCSGRVLCCLRVVPAV
jgi:hypothetical protein